MSCSHGVDPDFCDDCAHDLDALRASDVLSAQFYADLEGDAAPLAVPAREDAPGGKEEES